MADGSVVIEARLDTSGVTKGVKGINGDLNGISWKSIQAGSEKVKAVGEAFKKAGTACTVGLTTPVVAAGTMAFGVATDYESATSRIQAAFGVTREEAERFSGIGKSIYENGWGDSLDEVNDALIQCKSTLRDVSDEDLNTVTTNALMLSSVFGADVNESIRGTNALMEGFGLSATEASDLLTAGMQRGLNYTDELGDNLSEYSVRWGEAGMSASMYFSLLEAGTSNGAYNLDKVGDYLNEFLTALSDGRMEESIGKFSDGTQQVFENFKQGGATAEDVLQAVLGDITQMPNEYDKASLASTLWSSLGEDNAMGMIESLAGVQDSFGDVAGSAQQAGDAASDNFNTKWDTALRDLKAALEPMGDVLLNLIGPITDVAGAFAEWLGGLDPQTQQAVVAIAAVVAAVGPVLVGIGSVIGAVGEIGGAFGKAGEAASKALGLITNHPVIAFIALIVAAVVTLWNTNEDFRNAVTAAWDAVGQAFQAVAEIAGQVVDQIAQFFTGLGETLQGAWDTICSIVQVAVMLLESIISAAIEILLVPWNFIWENFGTTLQAAWDTICDAVSVAIGLVQFYINSALNVIQAVWSAVWGTVSAVASTIWGVISGAASSFISGVQSVISSVLGAISSVWSSIWGAISSVASSVWSTISSVVGTAVNGIRSTVESVFNTVKGTVDSVWNGIKTTISDAINGAKNVVKSGLDSISGFFSGLHLSFPSIKLPHFSIKGEFSLTPPSVPSFGIEWYAKGGVFNGATIAGIGEAGPEMALPLNARSIAPFAREIAGYMPAGQTGGGTVVYSFGDINVKMDDMRDLATLDDFVALVLEAKRANPIRTRS